MLSGGGAVVAGPNSDAGQASIASRIFFMAFFSN